MNSSSCWREELLKGVSVLEGRGKPGTLAVYGENAIPVLTGNGVCDVIMAAAEYGSGRVIVFSHDDYSKGFHKNNWPKCEILFKNIKAWLTNDSSPVQQSEICYIEDWDTLIGNVPQTAKILVWPGMNKKQPLFTEEVLQFVADGGGIVCGMTPRGWMDNNKGQILVHMPQYNFLKKVGIAYTEEHASLPPGGASVADNKASAAHMSNIFTDYTSQTAQDLKRYHFYLPQDTIKTYDEMFKLLERSYNIDEATAWWREEILKGITSLEFDSTLGTLVVHGEKAIPILTGEGVRDVILAAAEHWLGRVIVFSHDEYSCGFYKNCLPKCEALFQNIKSWLTRGTTPVQQHEICFIEDMDTLQGNVSENVKILVWQGKNKKPPSFTDEVLKFVENGGGIVCGMTPWGWLSLFEGETLQDMPQYNFLKVVGIAYTEDVASMPSGAVSLAENKAHEAHMINLLINPYLPSAQELMRYLDYLPFDVAKTFAALLPSLDLSRCCPCTNNPVTREEYFLLKMEEFKMYTSGEGIKAKGVEHFPGDFFEDPLTETVSLHFRLESNDWEPTGYYLPAGKSLNIYIKGNKSGKWQIRIGCHTDNHWYDDVDRMERWPNLIRVENLNTKSKSIHSPFGGLIYLKCSTGRGNLDIKMKNVVQAPFFDLTDSGNISQWAARSQAPAPWADMKARFITITLPSKHVRNVTNPGELMALWDKVVQVHHHLDGTDVLNSAKEHVVPDIQIKTGNMHSGHPIVVLLRFADTILFNDVQVLDGSTWGMYHELGHNYQQNEWTFEGTTEVTCNIYALHASEIINGVSPMNQSWLRDKMNTIKQFLQYPSGHDTWKNDAGIGLGVYAQLAVHFGWGAYKAVFRQYSALLDWEKPTNNQEKIDTWVKIFSEVVGYDLTPLFELWCFPLSEGVKHKLQSLQPCLPDDEMTQATPDRVADIIQGRGNLTRSPRKFQDMYTLQFID